MHKADFSTEKWIAQCSGHSPPPRPWKSVQSQPGLSSRKSHLQVQRRQGRSRASAGGSGQAIDLCLERSSFKWKFFKASSNSLSIFRDYSLKIASWGKNNNLTRLLRADFWEGDATKHFSVKKKGFSVKRGEGIQWIGGLVRISTGRAIQWRGLGHSRNRRTLKLKSCNAHPLPENRLRVTLLLVRKSDEEKK